MSIVIEALGRDDPRLDQLPSMLREKYESMDDKGLQALLAECFD